LNHHHGRSKRRVAALVTVFATAALVVQLSAMGVASADPWEAKSILVSPATANVAAPGTAITTAYFTDTIVPGVGLPVEGVEVTWTKTGPGAFTSADEDTVLLGLQTYSDVDGEAVVTTSSTVAGASIVTGTISNVLTQCAAACTDASAKTWSVDGSAARFVDVSPDTAVNGSGTVHTVTATATDIDGNPVEGVWVDFTETGTGNFVFGSTPLGVLTDENGEAEAYTTTFAGQVGVEDITATIDAVVTLNPVPNDCLLLAGVPVGSLEDGICEETVTKTWTAIAPSDALNIDLAPNTAVNSAGDTHDVTATVTDVNGDPVEGVVVTFRETGVGAFTAATLLLDEDAVLSGVQITTDVDGEAVVTTTTDADETGVQEITGTIDASDTSCGDVDGNCTETVTKTWQGVARFIDLLPKTATNAPGTIHTVTATVTDVNGEPVEGVEVDFTETGIGFFVAGSDTTVETDANGEAEAYTTTIAGQVGDEEITGTIDDATTDCGLNAAPAGICEDTVDKTWAVPVVVAPVITSFDPISGPVGTSVTITGTDLTGATAVAFNAVSATIVSNTATAIVTAVPATATTGPITVTTAGGTATSATDFTVTVAPVTHARTITLRLRDALIAKGKVLVTDAYTACAASVTVQVQKRVRGIGWVTKRTIVTSSTGAYSTSLRNKSGKYRALAPEVLAGTDTCLLAKSPRVAY
jgi:protocatechuate 3,4-dioxygenase beta subunit